MPVRLTTFSLGSVRRRSQKAVKGEVTHCLYQALSRGSIRRIKTGVAEPMNAWVMDKLNDARERLTPVLPGAKWVEWEPMHLATEGKTQKITKMIKDYLQGLSQTVSRVSTKAIKASLGLEKGPKMTFTKAVRSITEDVCSGWTLDGRSLVRFQPFANG